MSRHGPWATLALVATVFVGLVVMAPRSGGGHAPDTAGAVPESTPELVAVVCRRIFTDFAAQIASDAPAHVVLADLERTLAIARRGADRDATVEPLAAGVGALRASLITDDPDAADIALRVLRTSCAAP